MFQYTNTILVNSLKDATTGLDKFVKGTNVLEVLRVQKFIKDNVKSITKRPATDPIMSRAEFTVAKADKGFYRLYLYIRLSGSQNSYYSNDFVFKGKPLAYEYKIENDNTTGADVAKIIKNVVDKLQAFYGEKWIKVQAKGDKLTIVGTDEYQLITEASLLKLTSSTTSTNPGTPIAYNPEYFDNINPAKIVPNKEGFGTYTMILKDLRLPTMEARRYEGINQEELPILGKKYTQYVITYKKDRGLFGGAAVGQQVTSVTTHVFFVMEDLVADFDAILTGTIGAPSEVKDSFTISSGVDDITDMVKAGTGEDITPTVAGATKTWVTAYTEADWLTVTPSSTKVTFTGTDNGTGANRIATAIVTIFGDNGATVSKNIKITQKTT